MGNILTTLSNNLPWLWVAVTVICIVIETLTLSLTTIWFAGGALVAAILAACVIQSGEGKCADRPVCILCDGTTFYKTNKIFERVKKKRFVLSF